MVRLKEAIKRIKILECPTGDLENRVATILEDYGVASRNDIRVNRNEELDRNGSEAYVAKILSNRGQSIVVLSQSGLEDYVAKVVEVYTE